MTADVVFFLDVDNTLLDNDAIISELRLHLATAFGAASADKYWVIFERVREELGYADYLGAVQRYRAEADRDGIGNPRLLFMSSFLLDYPFAEKLYPHALEVIAHLGKRGPTVILSDGDVVFQPRKVPRSGLWQAVDGRVLIYIHEEQMLDQAQRLYPARRYVMIDDKLRLLSATKQVLADRLVTVFPRHGHYARDPTNIARYPVADVSIDHIGDLLEVDLASRLGAIQETS